MPGAAAVPAAGGFSLGSTKGRRIVKGVRRVKRR